jgi:hypothetical protein
MEDDENDSGSEETFFYLLAKSLKIEYQLYHGDKKYTYPDWHI